MNSEPLTVIALGSNLGNSHEILSKALTQLQKLSITPLRTSTFWETEPIDCPPSSPTFVNAVTIMSPKEDETPETLLLKLQDLEREFGRQPKLITNEARPLDLDIIAFRNELRSEKRLTLPHPRAHLRRFVLGPLAELAPEYKLPGQALTTSELLARLP